MSQLGGSIYVNPNKMFEIDDDVKEDTCGEPFRTRIPPPKPSKPAPSAYGSHKAASDQQRQALLEKKREIEKQTVDSSIRSIRLLRESENIGIVAVEELSRQGEQLKNANKRLDELNTNLNHSQKHLNGIKSVFHGLKNYISGKSDQAPRSQPSPGTQSAGTSSNLDDAIDNLTQVNSDDRFRSHPATRLYDLDAQVQVAPISDSRRVDQVLDANFDEMLHSISRLTCLATALGKEIEQQNELIDIIHVKVDDSDIKMGEQNNTMKKILGK